MAMRTYAITESPTDNPKTQHLFVILSGLYPIRIKIYIISTIFFEIFRTFRRIIVEQEGDILPEQQRCFGAA